LDGTVQNLGGGHLAEPFAPVGAAMIRNLIAPTRIVATTL